MNYQHSLQAYVKSMSANGHNFTHICTTLAIQQGYSLPVAQRIVEAVLDFDGNNSELFFLSPDDPRAVPQIDLTSLASIPTTGKPMSVVFEQLSPRIVLLENFLSEDECAELCGQCEGLFQPSSVVDPVLGGARMVEIRSSDSAHVPNNHSDLVRRVNARIEKLANWPASSSEPLQVQRYLQGQHYVPHYDFFPDSKNLPNPEAGQRLATLIVYLRQPDQGGATYFANLGMRVLPKVGSALFFVYPDAEVGSGTLHGGEAVGGGEKWIITKWFRERDFNWEAMQ
ncbi:prolyl 4-hydroxylase [Roseateles asaccharophilus]|uniref:prolyl hydroxylase family protein n=1 Tax=Roseateles asaccharophilus TaxID=582607 RepID=UPI0038360BCA